MSTLVASYLARARGSNEPEFSTERVRDLDHFLRECRAFKMDHGNTVANAENELEEKVQKLRRRLEELLGNTAG